MSDIFISYASDDRERIMPLVRALELENTDWTVFWDRTIPISKTWREVIGAELSSFRSMIVVWSKISLQSNWVLEEAEEGKQRRILFPVLIDDVVQPLGFRNIQAANLVYWDGKPDATEFRRLIADLTMLLDKPPAVVDVAKSKVAEEEQKQKEEEAKRIAAEEERKQKEEERKAAEKEAKRKAAEKERKRKAAEKEAKRKAAEKERKRKEEERKAEAEREIKKEDKLKKQIQKKPKTETQIDEKLFEQEIEHVMPKKKKNRIIPILIAAGIAIIIWIILIAINASR